MNAFLNSFFSTLGMLCACGLCVVVFAIVELIYDMIRNGFTATMFVDHIASATSVDHNANVWTYSETKKTNETKTVGNAN